MGFDMLVHSLKMLLDDLFWKIKWLRSDQNTVVMTLLLGTTLGITRIGESSQTM